MKKITYISSKEKKELILFLKKNHEFNLSNKKYNYLFSTQWTKKKKLGIIVRQKGQIVGFFGLLFADRNFYNKTKLNIINVHTWVVKKKFRYVSLNLLQELNKINGILISHSSLITLKEIFLKFGWEVLEEFFYILPVSFFSILNKNYNFNLPAKSKIKKIVNDHIKTGSKFINIKVSNKNLIIIFNIRRKIIFKISEIIYISDIQIFNDNLRSISKALFVKYKILFLKIDSRFINKKNNKNFQIFKFKYKTHLKLYKNNKNIRVDKTQINNLYSEFQLI